MDVKKGSYGYAGTILKINLTDNTIERIPTDKYVKFIGGVAMGTAIYWDEVPPECDALDPENAIIWTCGPGCGVLGAGPSRVGITTKAFNTTPQAYSATATGAGHWGAELRFSGFDGLIVKGAAKTPVYITIFDDDVQIRPADQLWGKKTRDCDNEIKRLWGVSARVAQIGPAGENLHGNAIIMTDFSHATGNGGFGAVMGSKKLKAVVVHGTGGIKVADPKRVIELFHNKVLLEGPNPNGAIQRAVNGATSKTSTIFTPASDEFKKMMSAITPHTLEDVYNLDSDINQRANMLEDMKEGHMTFKFGGCWSCPGGCHFSARFDDINIPTTPMNLCHQAHVFKPQRNSLEDKFWGRADYLFSCLCDDYGMTVDIFGSSASMLYSLLEENVLTAEDFGINREWDVHDPEAWLDEQLIRELVYNVCYRKGSERFNSIALGPNKCLEYLIENGTEEQKAGARKVYDKHIPMKYYYANDAMTWANGGKPLKALSNWTMYKFAHHGSDMKLGGGLHTFTADSSDRLKAGDNYYSNRLFGKDDAWKNFVKDEDNSFTGIAEPVIFLQNMTLEGDSFSSCGWAGWPLFASQWTEDGVGSAGVSSEMYNAITGNNYYFEEQNERWGVAWTLARCIHAREGRRKEHDLSVLEDEAYSKRYIDAYPGGREGYKQGIEEYYEARGWDPETGIPRRSTLEKMGLKNVADEMEQKYGIKLAE